MRTCDRLAESLLDLRHAVRTLYGGRSGQQRVLLTLADAGTLSQRDLAARLRVCPSSASEILAKLSKAGLVAQRTHKTRTDVYLTDAGRVRAAEAAEQYRTACEHFFACLSGEEEEALLSMIERLSGVRTESE